MKKLLSLILVAVAGYVVLQQVEAGKYEQDLWAEATQD
jgi:hypothetical protein